MTVEQVAMDNVSEDMAEVSLSKTCQRWIRGRPKRERSLGCVNGKLHGVYATGPAYSIVLMSRKMDARNGGSRWVFSASKQVE